MNIFGITLSQSDLWLLGVCGAILALWGGPRIAESIKHNIASRVAYRRAFDDAVLNITENPKCTLAMIAQDCHSGILAAISNYRPDVTFWRRRAFERAVSQYKEAYDIATEHGSVFAIALSEKTEVAYLRRKNYHTAIKRLRSFA